MQYDINTQNAEISGSWYVKTNQYKYMTGLKILPPHQSRIEKARFTYSSLGKPFEKQVKLLKSKEKNHRKKINRAYQSTLQNRIWKCHFRHKVYDKSYEKHR